MRDANAHASFRAGATVYRVLAETEGRQPDDSGTKNVSVYADCGDGADLDEVVGEDAVSAPGSGSIEVGEFAGPIRCAR